MNNFWLKKYEKSATDVTKGKQWKGDFLGKSSNVLITIWNILHYLILFLPIRATMPHRMLETDSGFRVK